MLEEAVPFCDWEVRGAGGETGKEMILKYADGTFGSIAAMIVGGGEFKCEVFFDHCEF